MSGTGEAQGKASTESNRRDPNSRAPYSPPKLTRYGDLAKLTEGGIKSGHDTGTGSPGTKL
jgi:hypothetical protein